jgi:hypothetical protein
MGRLFWGLRLERRVVATGRRLGECVERAAELVNAPHRGKHREADAALTAKHAVRRLAWPRAAPLAV